jgi:hypothetical protein
MQHFFWHIVVLCRNFEECSKIWPSLSPPCEVDHNSQTVQSCVSLEKKNVKTASNTSGNHPFLGPVNFLRDASHPLIAALCFRQSRTLLSLTPKIAAALQFPLRTEYLLIRTLPYMIAF